MKNLKKHLPLFILFLVFIPFGMWAQSSGDLEQALKGLRRLTKEELTAMNSSKNLDLQNVTFYTSEGKKLEMMDAIGYLQNKDYAKELYVNEQKEPQALVFRKRSAEELEKKKKESFGNGVKVQEIAKPFTVTDIYGKKYDLNLLKGKIVVLNFWFAACKPCIQEMPELNKIVEKYAEKDVVFLGITFDDKKLATSAAKKHKFKYAIVPNAKEMLKTYDISVFPTHLIIDQNAKVVYLSTGYDSKNTLQEIEQNIQKYLSPNP